MTGQDDQTADQTAKPDTAERRGTPNSSGPEGAAGGMGSSSERVGPTGPGQVSTDGLRDTSRLDTPADAPPEQSPGGEEPQPEGVDPRAGYPTSDPRHEDKPYST
ncbi:hypothetical protein GCM10011376_04110 [Nocardioides flavus (ex Wang et al. 2016)]|uniref:Uncharacterized protein n=1 Tax=Nocardioides flavus (ex Wang et al. 2016) TaxID=2058780 RepID=A0ABQ3HEV7_9ACTN|nr:hypothetical protein [Nocardioides flavus (ex Wang et al. 2016)]GHE15518.1 hypothetical protein GCM10011376_04110 [Nocardioides flavus (ex Wang et al. 2016)]